MTSTPRTPPSFTGRGVERDQASRRFAIARRVEVEPVWPVTKLWNYNGPLLDQFYLGACTGFSATYLLNTAVNSEMRPAVGGRRPYLREPFAINTYSIATSNDPWPGAYPPEDTGSSGLAAMKALQIQGRIDSYWWAFTFDELVHGAMYGPLSVGSWWRGDMMDVDTEGYIHYSGDYYGGHQWTVLGVNMRGRYFTGINSWGAWGMRNRAGAKTGRFRISFDDMRALMAEDGDVVQPKKV